VRMACICCPATRLDLVRARPGPVRGNFYKPVTCCHLPYGLNFGDETKSRRYSFMSRSEGLPPLRATRVSSMKSWFQPAGEEDDNKGWEGELPQPRRIPWRPGPGLRLRPTRLALCDSDGDSGAQRTMEEAVSATVVQRTMEEETTMMEHAATTTRWIQTQPLHGTISTGTIPSGQLGATCRRLGFASGSSRFTAMGL